VFFKIDLRFGISLVEGSRVRHTEDYVRFEVWSIQVYGDVIWID
jgi:hypothetical protein